MRCDRVELHPHGGKEGQGQHGEGDVPVPAVPGADFVIGQADFLLGDFEAFLNGLIANDKFCWTRTLQLHLSWSRARNKLKWPTPRHLSAEVSPHGAEHAAEAHLARPADRRADGDRPAALGPGLPASPAMGGNASSCADRGAGTPNPAGDVSCE